MKRILIALSALLLLTGLAASAHIPAFSTALAPNGSGVLPKQYWRMGFTLQPSPVYANTAGRLASLAAELKSDKNIDVYFAFPAIAGNRIVHDASFYILDRTGAYTGTVSLSLEVYNFAGALQRVVSAGNVDLQTAPPQVWTKLALSGAPADRILIPGEFLAFHLALDGSPAGDLQVRPIFEVAVGPFQTIFPFIHNDIESNEVQQ